jgi:DNA-binding response OmpR family regulator
MSRGARILFVEDEPAIADPFGRALSREGYEVVPARSVAEARARFARQPPDLVLLDLTLPDGDGRDLCHELRAVSRVPIIMLTARGTELDRVTGLEIGADDYVVKPFSGAEVVARIRAVLRRAESSPTTEGPIVLGDLVVDAAARRARVNGRELALSRKEFDLLAELARHAGAVVTREELMARVWDENWFGSTKTLDVHMGWLRRKLGDDASTPRYLHTIRGVGFRLGAPEHEAHAEAAS